MDIIYSGSGTVEALVAAIKAGYVKKSDLAGLVGITYLESTTESPVYVRDLASGSYIFYGKFKPYSGSTSTMSFSSKLLVSVVRGNDYSSVMVLYPVNNTIQYMKITDSAIEKKYVYLNDLVDSVGSLSDLTTEDTSSMVAAINECVQSMSALAAIDLSNVTDDAFKAKASSAGVGIPVVSAASTDGVAYTATVEGVTELYNGLIITIIPEVVSASTAPTLNVNGLGAKTIRLPLSFNNAAMSITKLATYFTQGRPITIQFDANYIAGGMWKTLGKQKTSAQDLYGVVPVESGGVPQPDETDDEGKFLRAVAGVPTWVSVPNAEEATF